MITNFERAKIVLDVLDARASAAAGASIDSAVIHSLQGLTAAYPGLTSSSRPPIDYTQPATHIAYAFRCLPSHGDLVFRTLASAPLTAAKAISTNPVRVACIGGGPGSDMLGVLKFAESRGLATPSFEFIVLDREPAWTTLRTELALTFGGSVTLAHYHQDLDLAAGPPWTPNWAFANADVITFSFSLSEVWSFNGTGSVSGFLHELFARAKKGAIFVYVDNGGPNFTPLMEAEVAKRGDIKELVRAEDTWMLIGSDEQSSVVDSYKARYGESPKMTGTVDRRMWVKT